MLVRQPLCFCIIHTDYVRLTFAFVFLRVRFALVFSYGRVYVCVSMMRGNIVGIIFLEKCGFVRYFLNKIPCGWNSVYLRDLRHVSKRRINPNKCRNTTFRQNTGQFRHKVCIQNDALFHQYARGIFNILDRQILNLFCACFTHLEGKIIQILCVVERRSIWIRGDGNYLYMDPAFKYFSIWPFFQLVLVSTSHLYHSCNNH